MVASGFTSSSFNVGVASSVVWPCGVVLRPVQVMHPNVHLGEDRPLHGKKSFNGHLI